MHGSLNVKIKKKTHCCAAMVKFLKLITMITVTYIRQQYRGNAFLLVLDNNDYEEAPES
jgi:hypothetical protein